MILFKHDIYRRFVNTEPARQKNALLRAVFCLPVVQVLLFQFQNKIVPEFIFRRRGNNGNRLLFYRMNKFYASGVEVDAAVIVGAVKPIF